MKISYLKIQNFKSIRELEISEMENALILVGKNNTGKTSVIDAILLATGNHHPLKREFLDPQKSIVITMKIQFTDDELLYYQSKGAVSKQRDYNKWLEEFRTLLPSFQENTISFSCHVNPEMNIRYKDGFQKIILIFVRFFRKFTILTRTEIWNHCKMTFLVSTTRNLSRC